MLVQVARCLLSAAELQTALALWKMLLGEHGVIRFELTEKWCQHVEHRYAKSIGKDVWSQRALPWDSACAVCARVRVRLERSQGRCRPALAQ
jgi:hypothetical protein